MKKIVSLLLVITLLCGLLVPVYAEAKTVTVELLASGLAENTYDSTYTGSISLPNNKTFSGTTYIKAIEDIGATLEYKNSTNKNIGLKYTGLLISPTVGLNGTSVLASALTGISVSGTDLTSAGFPEASIKSGYDYYFIVIFCSQLKKGGKPIGDDYAVLVQIKKAGSDSVDKSDLAAEITKAEGKNASNCKTENDRYNAGTKAVSENGFWSDFQAALTSAKSVNDSTAATQKQVDSALEALTTAMANLIPIGQINPTNLYETIERCKKSNDDLKGYNDKTVNAYRTALTEANAYLESLFQKNDETGKVEPTTENVAGNQGKADGYATKLTNAYKELASALDRYGSVSLALDAIPALCDLADKAIGNTALDGRDTLKTKRDAAYAVWQEYVETQLNLNASEYREIRTAYRTLFDAYYLGLTNTAESITVNVRVTDSASLKDPDFYHVDSEWTSTTWTGSVTLTGDQTLGALETQLGSKLYNKGRLDGYGAASYAALINGVYAHSLQSFSYYFSDDYNENGTRVYYSDRYVLHDGDTVELVLLPQPKISSYAGAPNPLAENYTMRYMQTARFEQDGVPVTGTLTVNEGEPLTLHVSRAYASLQNYTGEYSAFSGAELYVSPESASSTAATAGEAVAPSLDTGYQTDANGDVTVTLYGSGWVHLYAADLRDDKGFWGNTDVSGGPQIEELPSMTAGASVWVYVNAKSGDELASGLAALKQELDDSYQDVDRTLFTEEELKQIDDTYNESCEKFKSLDNLTDAKALVREFDALVAQLSKQHQGSDAWRANNLRYALDMLPDDLNDFTQGFAERFRWLQSEMALATEHQINQMSTAQKAKYEKLKEAYGTDGSTLKEAVNPTVTVTVTDGTEYQGDFIVANNRSYSYVSSEYANGNERVNIPSATGNLRKEAALGAFDATDYRVQEGSEYQLIIARKLDGKVTECDYNAKVVKIEVLDKDTGKPIEGVTTGIYNYTEDRGSSRARFYYTPDGGGAYDQGEYGMTAATVRFTCVMPHNILVKVYLEKVATPDELTAAKTSLKNELTAAYQTYTKSEYSNTNWNTLVKAYNDGIANIEKAEDVTTATDAKTAALAAMADVVKDMEAAYGTVYVTVENTTFTRDLWPTGKTYWDGTPIDHFPVELDSTSTMMSCVVEALDEHGWKQTGASSNYITSINGLSAFDGGSQSGWMGTLNDWFNNEGFGNFTVANGKLGDGDEIRIMYTRTGYGADLGGTWGGEDAQNTTLKELKVTGGTIFPDFTSGTIGSTTEYTLQIADEKAEIKITPTATNKNFLVKTFLNEQVTDNTEGVSFYKRTQTIPVVAGDTIYVGCGVKGWPTMNTQAGNTQTSGGTWYVLKVVNAQVDDGSAYVMGLIDKYCIKVESYNYKSMESGLSITRAAYDALSEDSQKNVTNYQKLLDAEAGVASFKKTADLSVKIAALPSVYRATLEDVEQIKSVQKIYESLTQEEKDRLTVNEYNKLMALIEKIDGLNQEAANKVIADITAIGPIDKITLESAKQIQTARAGYAALNKYAQYIVECAKPVNYYTLLDAEAKLKELQDAAAEQERIDKAAAAAVDSLIDEIGDVTLDSKQAIETARAAYDNLTPTQKTYVTKLDTLTAAETAYKALVDRKAADDVMEKINEIGKVTLESKTAIEAARAAYNALTNDQKTLVENYDVLTAAEAELARLEAEAKHEADLAAAAQVDEMIERLFPVNRYSGPAIRMARAAYDALTEDQKALVKHYDDLVKAEAEFAAIPPLRPVGPSKPSKPSTPDTSKDNLPFTDVVSGSWYYDGVKYAYDNGLMNGTGANAFNPNADTTRGMIVTILARMEGVNTSGGATWYTAGREWAMENGISDGTNMEGKITREQLAAMLYRYAKMKGYDVSASASLSGYTDASSVSGWAKEAMQWAVGSGLIQGSNNALTPQANASRAQIATILMRFAQNIAK